MTSYDGTRPAPGWFRLAALAAVTFYALGCWMYLDQVMTDPADLAADQRAVWDAAPGWMIAANAIAVWIGLAGAILLVLRKRSSELALLIALIAVIVQFSALLLVPALRNLATSDALFLPAVIILLSYGFWHLARLARKNQWLR